MEKPDIEISWEEWKRGRARKRELLRMHGLDKPCRRSVSSSDKRLRAAFGGERAPTFGPRSNDAPDTSMIDPAGCPGGECAAFNFASNWKPVLVPDIGGLPLECERIPSKESVLDKIRRNRLVDFLFEAPAAKVEKAFGVTFSGCEWGEVDDLYIVCSRTGVRLLAPVVVSEDSLSIDESRIESVFRSAAKMKIGVPCFPVGISAHSPSDIDMMVFGLQENKVCVQEERHYRLVRAAKIFAKDLKAYSDVSNNQNVL